MRRAQQVPGIEEDAQADQDRAAQPDRAVDPGEQGLAADGTTPLMRACLGGLAAAPRIAADSAAVSYLSKGNRVHG